MEMFASMKTLRKNNDELDKQLAIISKLRRKNELTLQMLSKEMGRYEVLLKHYYGEKLDLPFNLNPRICNWGDGYDEEVLIEKVEKSYDNITDKARTMLKTCVEALKTAPDEGKRKALNDSITSAFESMQKAPMAEAASLLKKDPRDYLAIMYSLDILRAEIGFIPIKEESLTPTLKEEDSDTESDDEGEKEFLIKSK